MSLILDFHNDQVVNTQFSSNTKEAMTQYKYDGEYALLLHDPHILPGIRGEGIRLRPGYVVTIIIKAQMIESSEDVRNINKQDRKCLFHDEAMGKLKMTKFYTQETCLLECKIKEVESICNCVPWSYPSENGTKICDYFGHRCFDYQMRFAGGGCMEDCPTECSEVMYSYQG